MGAKKRLSRSIEPALLSVAQFLALGAQPDGTVVRVRTDIANGINWKLRFNAANTPPYGWELDGSPPPAIAVDSGGITHAANTTSVAYCPLVAPLDGIYDLAMKADIMVQTAGNWGAFRIYRAGAWSGYQIMSTSDTSGGGIANYNTVMETDCRFNGTGVLAPLTAGMTMDMRILTGAGGTVASANRKLTMRPVRLAGP